VIESLTVNVVPTPSLLETSMVPRFASTIPSRSTALGSIETNGITVVPEPTTLVRLVAAMIGGLASGLHGHGTPRRVAAREPSDGFWRW
jgi:hypothetical protein